MNYLILLILSICTTVPAQTNYIQQPDGSYDLATSDAGFYWVGLTVGFGFYVVGMVLKMSKRVGGGSYD
jgi:hypothetical protein